VISRGRSYRCSPLLLSSLRCLISRVFEAERSPSSRRGEEKPTSLLPFFESVLFFSFRACPFRDGAVLADSLERLSRLLILEDTSPPRLLRMTPPIFFSSFSTLTIAFVDVSLFDFSLYARQLVLELFCCRLGLAGLQFPQEVKSPDLSLPSPQLSSWGLSLGHLRTFSFAGSFFL